MDKKRFLRIAVLLMLLMATLPWDALALAREKTGGVSTEERWLERDGQKIYGRLNLPEKTGAPPLCSTISAAFVQEIVAETGPDMRAAA